MQQRSVFPGQRGQDATEEDWVTVVAFGAQHRVEPGHSVAQTLDDLGLAPQPYQSIRIGSTEVRDLDGRLTTGGDVVTVTNRVVGGRLGDHRTSRQSLTTLEARHAPVSA